MSVYLVDEIDLPDQPNYVQILLLAADDLYEVWFTYHYMKVAIRQENSVRYSTCSRTQEVEITVEKNVCDLYSQADTVSIHH